MGKSTKLHERSGRADAHALARTEKTSRVDDITVYFSELVNTAFHPPMRTMAVLPHPEPAVHRLGIGPWSANADRLRIS